LVQDQQVDLVDPELAGAFFKAVQGLVVAVVADPDLGLQEDLRPDPFVPQVKIKMMKIFLAG
jgi:hypothetical protein